MFITGLDGKRLHDLKAQTRSPADVVLSVGTLDVSGAGHRWDVCLADVEMVDVVFKKKGVGHPPSKERLIIGKAEDVFFQDVVGWFETLVCFVPSVVARAVDGVTQVDQVPLDDSVGEVGASDGKWSLVMAQRACPTGDFVA